MSGDGVRSSGRDPPAPRRGRRPPRPPHPPAARAADVARRARGRGPGPLRRGARPADEARECAELGARERDLPARLRPGLLRHRDDLGDRIAAGGPRADRRRGDSLLAAPGRPDHPLGPRLGEDGAGPAAHLRPDAGAEVGDRDGRLRVDRGDVQQLRGRPGRRQVHARGHLHARLPAAAGGADVRDHQAPEQDQGRARHGLAGADTPPGARAARATWAGGRATARRAPRKLPDATGLELIAAEVREKVGDETVVGTRYAHEQATLDVAPPAVRDVVRFLKEDAGESYDKLMSLHGVDYLPDEPRLGVHYELLSMERVERLGVRTRVGIDDPVVPSVVDVYPTANFQEREAYDFFGIQFEGHPDLRRILLPEDYAGFPQRRDYPIGGEPVIYTYNEHQIPRWYE